MFFACCISNGICTEVYAVTPGLFSFNCHINFPSWSIHYNKANSKPKGIVLHYWLQRKITNQRQLLLLWTSQNSVFSTQGMSICISEITHCQTLYIHKHTYTSVFSLPRNLNYVKEKLKWMRSNRTSHLLFTSTFQSFKSGLFPIFPEVLDSNRLSMKIPTEKLMYTPAASQLSPSFPPS